MTHAPPRAGLILSGGGARAAYQVGALLALADVVPRDRWPFPVIAGTSAGAINGVSLAGAAEDFATAAARLAATWRSLTPDQIYRTDEQTMTANALRWVRDLGAGGLLGPPRINFLLDTSPLRALLARSGDIERIPGHVRAGRLRAVAVTATNYGSGVAVTFFDGVERIAPWVRHGRVGVRARLTLAHVLASASIPLFFPPVRIDGATFGDGAMRLNTPLSPGLHLGADRLVAICVHHTQPADARQARVGNSGGDTVPVAQIGGALLDAAFMRPFDTDLERATRINATVAMFPQSAAFRRQLDLPLRRLDILTLRPAQDVGRLAVHEFGRLPRALRHLLRGIGASDERGAELLSYLAFEPTYVDALIELGRRDTLARRAEIEAFFAAPPQDPDFVPP